LRGAHGPASGPPSVLRLFQPGEGLLPSWVLAIWVAFVRLTCPSPVLLFSWDRGFLFSLWGSEEVSRSGQKSFFCITPFCFLSRPWIKQGKGGWIFSSTPKMLMLLPACLSFFLRDPGSEGALGKMFRGLKFLNWGAHVFFKISCSRVFSTVGRDGGKVRTVTWFDNGGSGPVEGKKVVAT